MQPFEQLAHRTERDLMGHQIQSDAFAENYLPRILQINTSDPCSQPQVTKQHYDRPEVEGQRL